MFSIFSGISLLISCLGLFGLALFESRQRMKEISIRKVLGAMGGQIMVLLAKGYVGLVARAFLIASPVAWLCMDHWLSEFAYRINLNPLVFVWAALLAVCVAITTVIAHAIKASRVNPARTLRNE